VAADMPRPKSGVNALWKRLKRNKGAVFGLLLVLLLVCVAVLAPVISPYDPYAQKVANRFKPPSSEHLMGTDELGRDILSRIIWGTRISLLNGLVAVLIAMTLGVSVGLLAGYYPALDNLIMRVADILMALPGILLAIAIVAALGPGLANVMIAVGISSVPPFVRITRASVLSIREHEYIEAARAVGARDSQIVSSHVLPNCVAPILVYSTLRLSTVILSTAILSFLGLGAQPPTPEWGAMVSIARAYLRIAPHTAFFPILAIFITVLAFNFVGDGLRDALDPRLKV